MKLGYTDWKLAKRIGAFVALLAGVGSSILFLITNLYVTDMTRTRITNQMLDAAEDIS